MGCPLGDPAPRAPHVQSILSLLDPRDWAFAPAVIVEQGRVAIGDDAAHCLGAALAVIFIGERPGLSSPDRLGIYLTWNPRPSLTDANRNLHFKHPRRRLSYYAAAHILLLLMTESRRRKLSGVDLKMNYLLAQPSSGAPASNT
jgi:ethanolamine ammonia-lyase small subunit